MVTVLD